MSNTKINIQDVIDFIYNDANKTDRSAISQALNVRRNDDILSARMEFKIGDKVKFNVRKRGYAYTVRGTVVRKNIKTIHVRPAEGGREWRVTASLLQRDEEPAKG